MLRTDKQVGLGVQVQQMEWGEVITKTPSTRLPPHCAYNVPRDELLLAPSVPYPIFS